MACLGEGIKEMTATDLVVFKTLFDRSKDWVDIEGLLESDTGDVDEATVWIARLVGQDDSRISLLRGRR